MAFEVKIGDRIRYYRIKNGFKSDELAEKLGVKQPNVSQMENNQRQPDLDKLVQMARIFGITLDELTGNIVEVSNEPEIIYKAIGDGKKSGLTDQQIADAIKFAAQLKTQA